MNIIKKILKRIYVPYPYKWYMIKNKFIFIHIPRTGGTSFTSLFNSYGIREHYSYRIYMLSNLKKFNTYFKFCFVRNPYDRCVSTYLYLKAGGNRKGDLYFKELIEKKYYTFDKFILDYLDLHLIHEHNLFKPQFRYIYNFQKECMVDFIGRYESINKDFLYISKKINNRKDLPHINRSNKLKIQTNYYDDSNVKRKVFDLYKKDFELLVYPE